MDIFEVTKEEYKKIVVTPFSRFELIEFADLNSYKADKVKYFVFNNSKNRFALIGGIKDSILKFPFSASFSCLSEITKNNRIFHYYEAIECLINWAKEKGLDSIRITCPPVYYASNHITKFINALQVNHFKILNIDVNYEYYLNNFDENYIKKLDIKARQHLKKSFNANLFFEKTDDVEIVYEVIKQNRVSKGYPLWMSLEDVKNTSKVIPTDLFLIKDENNKPVASALCHRITDKILRVVYWGNVIDSDYLSPMNFAAFKIFKWYKENTKVEIIDIGTSSENSIANFGLCDFKESIGCTCSPKINFKLELK